MSKFNVIDGKYTLDTHLDPGEKEDAALLAGHLFLASTRFRERKGLLRKSHVSAGDQGDVALYLFLFLMLFV